MAVENTPENLAKCVCDGCPSCNDCMREKAEKLFCATGKAQCEFDKKGCICMSCPVHAEYKLHAGYYCASGAA